MNLLRRIYVTLALYPKPRVGERVKVAVGFSSSYLNEGVVSTVYDDYCWVDQYNSKGEFINSFTASFSYCIFHFPLDKNSTLYKIFKRWQA